MKATNPLISNLVVYNFLYPGLFDQPFAVSWNLLCSLRQGLQAKSNVGMTLLVLMILYDLRIWWKALFINYLVCFAVLQAR